MSACYDRHTIKHLYNSVVMRSAILILLITLTGGLVSACSRTLENEAVALIPLSQDPIDPDNSAMVRAVQKFLSQNEAPASSLYDFSRVDLNHDGRRDALVLLKTPYGYWCGTHGCTMLVLKAHDDHFTLVNSVRPVRGPIYISDIQTKGWQDLIVHISGCENKAKDVALRFNGRTYPEAPSDLPAHDPSAFYRGRAVFK